MPNKVNKQDILLARIEALQEAANHLELSWTDNELEQKEGIRLCHQLRRRIEKIADILYSNK